MTFDYIIIVFNLTNLIFSVILFVRYLELEQDKMHAVLNVNYTQSFFNQDLLIFNRVPKAGSSNLASILGNLSYTNDFDWYTYLIDSDGFDNVIKSMSQR